MSCIAFYIYLGSCRGRLPGVGGDGGGLGEGEGDGQEAQDPSPAAAVLGALHRRPPTADNAAVCTQCIARLAMAHCPPHQHQLSIVCPWSVDIILSFNIQLIQMFIKWKKDSQGILSEIWKSKTILQTDEQLGY